MENRNAAIIVFVKYPEPGRVKTRLAKDIGEQAAADIYTQFVAETLAKIDKLQSADKYLFIDREDKRAETAMLWDLSQLPQVQRGEDLGERMGKAFDMMWEFGYKQALIVGSDSPDLPIEFLTEGLVELGNHDAVIGPSEDGGYYLLGFKRATFNQGIFADIPWSSSQVFAKTINKMKENGLNFYVLKEWYDVDTLTELKRYKKSRNYE